MRIHRTANPHGCSNLVGNLSQRNTESSVFKSMSPEPTAKSKPSEVASELEVEGLRVGLSMDFSLVFVRVSQGR